MPWGRPAEAQVLSTGAGAVGGLLAGTTVTMGLVVTRAHVEEKFIESPRDMIHPVCLPIVVGAAVGTTLGVTDPDRLETMGLWTDPRLLLVSGSASKLNEVGHTEGMLFRRSEPGYMRLMVLKDGSMRLFVESAPAEYLTCPEEEPERTTCMVEGVEAYRTVYGMEVP